ncbi:MAG: photosystem II reaction center PsbP family protein [Chamaesiphon sp.]|nr:photosystem II reaction center PsbP family protein [Chamaesiphon sp.]
MWKKITVSLIATLAIILQINIAPVEAAGLQGYIDTGDGYKFLYPNGWVAVKTTKGADIIFHDLIESSENVSVVISQVDKDKKLSDLGTASDVGYKLGKNAIAPPGSGREAELIGAETNEVKGKTYYILEYDVKLPNSRRHNIASVVISRGKLFTFNASTTDRRWTKMKKVFTEVVNSFSVA